MDPSTTRPRVSNGSADQKEGPVGGDRGSSEQCFAGPMVKLLREDRVLAVLKAKAGQVPEKLLGRAKRQRVKEVVQAKLAGVELHELLVDRQPAGYGFEVGTTEDSGHTVSAISKGGAVVGLLTAGDILVAINDSLLCDATHESVVSTITAATAAINVLVARPAQLSQPKSTVRVTIPRKNSEPLGLRLSTSMALEDGVPVGPTLVQQCTQAGLAHSAGLHAGDVIAAVNGVNVEGYEHAVILRAINSARNQVVIDVHRHTIDTGAASSNSVLRRNTGGSEVNNAARRRTVYAGDVSVPKKPMFGRFRAATNGLAVMLPASIAVVEMGRELAEESLAFRESGSFLFREAHGRIVLSVVHESKVLHFTLQIELNQPYGDVEKHLRNFVKYYSGHPRRSERAGIPCPLREYVLGAPSQLMRQLLSDAQQSSSESLDTSELENAYDASTSTVQREDKVKADQHDLAMAPCSTFIVSPGSPSLSRAGGPKVSPKILGSMSSVANPNDRQDPPGENRGHRLQIANDSFNDESAVDSSILKNSRVDEDGLPLMSPETEMFTSIPAPTARAFKPTLRRESSPTGATSPTTPKQVDSEQATPRRRKLVRGGNKKETPVLPEYQDALDALNDLDEALNKYDEMFDTLENLDGPKMDSQVSKKQFALASVRPTKNRGFAELTSPEQIPTLGDVPEKKSSSYASLMDFLY